MDDGFGYSQGDIVSIGAGLVALWCLEKMLIVPRLGTTSVRPCGCRPLQTRS